MANFKAKPQIKKDIINTIEGLKNYFRVREVILFGSQITGKVNKYSDIDLAVVSDDFKKKSLSEIIDKLSDVSLACDANIEIHKFTTSELKNARRTNFIGHILKVGKVIYANNHYLI